MPVEQDDAGNVTITGPEIDLFSLRALIGALAIEATTGLRHSRGSMLKIAQQRYGVTARTKLGGYKQLCELWHEITDQYPVGYERVIAQTKS